VDAAAHGPLSPTATHGKLGAMQPPPPITRYLLIACTVLLFIGQIRPLALMQFQWLAIHPLLSGYFWPWQVVTYAFVHDDVMHWLVNMLILYFFGSQLEDIWGERRYIQFVLASALAGAAAFLLLTLLVGSGLSLAGASGVGYGMLVAFGMLFPNRRILLFFVADVTMRQAVWIFIAIEVFLGLGNFFTASGAWITDVAHLGGALGGWLMLMWWRHRPPSRRKSPIRRVK
jgi:membrane associated rhomboid family serine protease